MNGLRLVCGGIASLLIAGALGGCVSDQPTRTSVDVRELPQEVVRAVGAGYPGAIIDRAECEYSQVGKAYRVYYHVGDDRYWADFFRHRKL